MSKFGGKVGRVVPAVRIKTDCNSLFVYLPIVLNYLRSLNLVILNFVKDLWIIVQIPNIDSWLEGLEGPSSIKKTIEFSKNSDEKNHPAGHHKLFFSLAQVPNFEANFCRKLPHYLSSSLKVRLRFNFDILNHFRLLLLLFIIIVKMQFFVITERSKILITYKRPARNVYEKIKVTWPEKKSSMSALQTLTVAQTTPWVDKSFLTFLYIKFQLILNSGHKFCKNWIADLRDFEFFIYFNHTKFG